MNSNTKRFPLWVKVVAVAFFILLLLFVFRIPILEKMGRNLVYQSDLVPSDAIVVLAGSHTGCRMEEAARIFKEGMGKVMIFGGYTYYPGMDSHIGMKQHAIKLGVPEDKIYTDLANGENSTWGEAIFNLKRLKELKAKSFILVTSAFHTKRSHRVYERAIKKLGMDIQMRVQPAADPKVPIPGWWKLRSGQKHVFIEYIKTIYYFFSY